MTDFKATNAAETTSTFQYEGSLYIILGTGEDALVYRKMNGEACLITDTVVSWLGIGRCLQLHQDSGQRRRVLAAFREQLLSSHPSKLLPFLQEELARTKAQLATYKAEHDDVKVSTLRKKLKEALDKQFAEVAKNEALEKELFELINIILEPFGKRYREMPVADLGPDTIQGEAVITPAGPGWESGRLLIAREIMRQHVKAYADLKHKLVRQNGVQPTPPLNPLEPRP